MAYSKASKLSATVTKKLLSVAKKLGLKQIEISKLGWVSGYYKNKKVLFVGRSIWIKNKDDDSIVGSLLADITKVKNVTTSALDKVIKLGIGCTLNENNEVVTFKNLEKTNASAELRKFRFSDGQIVTAATKEEAIKQHKVIARNTIEDNASKVIKAIGITESDGVKYYDEEDYGKVLKELGFKEDKKYKGDFSKIVKEIFSDGCPAGRFKTQIAIHIDINPGDIHNTSITAICGNGSHTRKDFKMGNAVLLCNTLVYAPDEVETESLDTYKNTIKEYIAKAEKIADSINKWKDD